MAVLLVVFCHAGVSSLQGGYVGVDVFFVLSGFLITGLLTAGATKSGYASLADFYSRRARRILPAAALTLVVTDVVAYALLNFVRAKAVFQDSIPASLFVANFHFIDQGANYFAQSQPPSPIQQFWTLSVEEQFYLVWPLIVLLVLAGVSLRRRAQSAGSHRHPPTTLSALRRLDVAIALIVAASLAWSVYYTHHDPAAAYFSTFTRAWELGLGAALSIAAARVARLPAQLRAALGWVGLGCIGVAAVSFSASTSFPGYAAVLPCAGAVLVILAGLGEGEASLAPGRVLSLWPFRYVGDRSYALYLWHWPALIIAMQYVGHRLSVGTNLLLVAGAFLLSIVSYAAVENPIRRMRWTPSYKALVLWPVSVLAVLLVAGWGIGRVDSEATRLASAGAPIFPGYSADSAAVTSSAGSSSQTLLDPSSNGGALSAVIGAVQAARRGTAVPAALTPPASQLLNDYYHVPGYCSPGLDQSRSSVCAFGTGSAGHTVLVFGDSHAQMWMPAIEYMADQDRWLVRAVWKSGCSPDMWWKLTGASAACRAWFPWAVRTAQSVHANVVLLPINFGGLGSNPAAAGAGVSTLVRDFARPGTRVLVMGDDYPQTVQPVDCLLQANAKLESCMLRPSGAETAISRDIRSGATSAGAKYIDVTGWFCYQGECPMVIGDTVVPRDSSGHITTSYAGELGEVFRVAFRGALGLSAPLTNQTPRTSSAGGALPAVVAAVDAVRRSAPIPAALTPSLGSLLGDHYNYPSGCGAEQGQSRVSVCTLGDTRAKRSLVIMGDSHAQMWMPAVLEMADQEGWAVRPVGKSACIPAEWWHVAKATSDCTAWYAWATQEIRSLHPELTILAGDFSGLAGHDGAAASGITSLIAAVRPASGHLVVLADPPPQTQQPVDCLLAQGANMARCSLTPSPEEVDVANALRLATGGARASYIDTTPWVCYQDSCPMVIGHTIVYVDPGHITDAYATELAAPFRAAIDRAIASGEGG